jgi:hypothetical protein
MEQKLNITDKRKQHNNIQSMGDLLRSGKITGKVDPTKLVHGPKNFDCLERPWSRGDITMIYAGAGIGKTSTILYIYRHILLNNPDGIVVFVSLEMTAQEIAEKWCMLTADCPEISDRFFMVENYDDQGISKMLTVDGIKYELKKIKEALGQTLIATTIDHLHQINNNGAMDYNPTMDALKVLAVEVDTHLFVPSQTTKGKGVGDIPVPKDGCFGTSKAEWLATHILTIFQPLLRVQKEADLPILGWQYAKIRYKNKEDKVKENMNYLLYFEHDTQNLRELSRQEKADFCMYYEKVLELRANEEKYKAYQFDLSETIVGKDGKTVKLDKIVGGGKPEYLDDEL